MSKVKVYIRSDDPDHKPLPVDAAWAAGFFDGEGCTTLNGKRAPNGGRSIMRMSIAQVELEPLIKFLHTVGLGTVRGPYQSKGNKQPHFQWNASGADCLFVLDKLWEHLGVSKQKQALDKVDLYELYLDTRSNKGTREKRYS